MTRINGSGGGAAGLATRISRGYARFAFCTTPLPRGVYQVLATGGRWVVGYLSSPAHAPKGRYPPATMGM